MFEQFVECKKGARIRRRQAPEERFLKKKLFSFCFRVRKIADLGVFDQIIDISLHALLIEKLTKRVTFGLIVDEALGRTNAFELDNMPAQLRLDGLFGDLSGLEIFEAFGKFLVKHVGRSPVNQAAHGAVLSRILGVFSGDAVKIAALLNACQQILGGRFVSTRM